MNSREERDWASGSGPPGDLESPFLEGELYARQAEPEWEARLTALVGEDPFQHFMEQEGHAPAGKGSSEFPLSKGKLAGTEIVIAKAGSKEKSVFIREAPAVFLPEIIGMARDMAAKAGKSDLASKLDPGTWFSQFTRITFLGRPLASEQYVHLEMARLLKAIESELVKKYGGSAKSVGDMLLNQSTEEIRGSRLTSSTAKFSMHMFGVAVDVNYLGNPYIQTKKAINLLNSVLKNAALLMNTPVLSYKQGYAKGKFDDVRQLDSVLESYFALLDEPERLAQAVGTSGSPKWRGLSEEKARNTIQKDLNRLAARLARVGKLPGDVDKKKYTGRKAYFKEHAILDLDKRFVVAMESRGLAWGGHYGDMMHFDMRGAGVGYYVDKARRDYGRKAAKLAKRLLKEGKYGTYSLKDIKQQYAWELQEEGLELEDDDLSAEAPVFGDIPFLTEDAWTESGDDESDYSSEEPEYNEEETFLDQGPAAGSEGQHEGEEHELDSRLGKTIYLPIRLNRVVFPEVGVFILGGFQPAGAIDLIVYFHGHIIRACGTDPGAFRRKGMLYYWNTPLFTCLREQLATSGRQAILIAPAFRPIFASRRSSSRDYGDLNKAGKFDYLIYETLRLLQADGVLPTGVQVRNVVLSAHSGGGLPMQRILGTANTLRNNIVECWGFECLYFGTSAWERWLKADAARIFRHFRRRSKFERPAGILKKNPNFDDVNDGTDHCRIVQQKWREALGSSKALRAGAASRT